MLAVIRRRLKENYYKVTERHNMGGERGGSQVLFHSEKLLHSAPGSSGPY